MKEKSKASNWIVDHFSLTFVNLLLPWMFYFHVWLQGKNPKVWSEYYYRFGIYQTFSLSLLEPRQNNLTILIGKNLFFVFSCVLYLRVYWNRSLGASDLFQMLTQSNKFYKFHDHILKIADVSKRCLSNRRLLLSASFTAKFELVFALTQENTFS